MSQQPIQWNVMQVWNRVAMKDNFDIKKRDYVYASEIGMPFYDRWHKMHGTQYTNPPNDRSLRKFLAGNLWEDVLRQVFIACGLLKMEEVKIDGNPYPDTLGVHGRCDFIAGGYIDKEEGLAKLKDAAFNENLLKIGLGIIESIGGGNLIKKILELKAVSTFAMDKVERMGAAIPNHALQATHYMKCGNIQADVVYVCKDDCRMAQFPVILEVTEPLYREDLLQMTEYYKKKKPPPKAPLASFDFTLGKFNKNLGVEYSPYLSHYGFENPDHYRQAVAFIEKWNRALTRFALAETGGTTPTGKPITITPKNNEVKAEIIKAGYKFNDLLQCKIELGATDEEEE